MSDEDSSKKPKFPTHVQYPVAKGFLHSCYIRKTYDGGDAVVVSEISYNKDGTTVPQLCVYPNPMRSVYVTKKQFQNHTDKKEIEDLDKLDRYVVPNAQLGRELFKILNGYYSNRYVNPKELFDNPYVYGADMHIQTLIKNKYKTDFEASGIKAVVPTTGFFDIERSVIPASMDTLIVLSVTHENTIYTAILDAFFYKEVDGRRIKGDLNELAQMSKDILTPIVEETVNSNKYLKMHKDRLPFKVEYFVGSTEIELVEWIFSKVHENRTSFMGVWNIDYDIPAIMDVLRKAGVEPSAVFCPPELDPKYRYVEYRKDFSKTDHPADKWHWLSTTSYVQFYDAMCLYSKLRTVKGKESSYGLDAILKKNGIEGKLHFPELTGLENMSKVDWHRHMQLHEFYRYIIYNQYDVISIQLMEWMNRDTHSMLLLSNVTSLDKFPRQTRRVADTLYTDWLGKGKVLATAGSNMRADYDREIKAVGGAVLSPFRIDKNGLHAIIEYPTHSTRLHIFVNDVDFTGMYPNVTQGANISKGTKLSTVLYITSPIVQLYYSPREAVEAFFAMMVTPQDNAVMICKQYFGFPGYETIEAELAEELPELKELLTPVPSHLVGFEDV